MLEGERSYQRGQGNLVPSNNASSIPESPVIPKAQEKPWYIQHFTKLLIGFGLGGGAIAILLPWMLWLLCGMSSGSSDQLRLHLLYVTGGIIAVLTLLQTNWKNQGDRLKIDADIKKNEQDAEKNERDHIRQVHAERRSRYTKAVEQLADEKATVRLGGIYTLVGLVDEWLADDTLEVEEQQKEGQVIINNLCSYIRSPFPLVERLEEYQAHKDLEELEQEDPERLSKTETLLIRLFRARLKEPNEYKKAEDVTVDYAELHEEQDIRRTIFVEMSKRSSTLGENEKGEVTITSGVWSNFAFDFTRAPIFYPLNNLTIEEGNFLHAKFYTDADFRKVVFIRDANFSKAIFIRNANFNGSTFTGDADFFEATFIGCADFFHLTFTTANFIGTVFTTANFVGAIFTDLADFSDSTFTTANFIGTLFIEDAVFLGAAFAHGANFDGATFTQNVDFSRAIFEETSPKFADASKEPSVTFRAQFNALPEEQEVSDFTVDESSQPILLGTAVLDGVSCGIPIGTVLFDPASWDARLKEYTRLSEPAQ